MKLWTGPRVSSRVRSFESWCLLFVVLVLVILVDRPASAQDPETSEAAVREEAAAETHEAHGGHAGRHYHRNHIALFMGPTEAEEEHGEKEDPDFTLGLDYERRLTRVIGIGVLVDFVVEGKREYLVGVPVFLHAGRSAKFQIAPGFHYLRHTDEAEFLVRTGFLWDFPVQQFSISPALFYDITEGQNFFVLGVNLGMGF